MTNLTGRQLDAAVAERCFKQTAIWINDHRGVGHPYLLAPEINGGEGVGYYQANMAAAWQVAEWIIGQGYHLEISVDKDSTSCEVWDDDKEFPSYWNIIVDVDAPTAQEAICRAALALAERIEQETSDG